MIEITRPLIIKSDERHTKLSCDIIVDGTNRNVWFEVEDEYAKYLCSERADAFVIGLLSWAMRLNHNIVCQVPVTEEILYSIKTYVIPQLYKYSKNLYNIEITAETAPALSNDGAVGTGCSCGVDSFHSILNNINSEYKDCKLTHIVLNNVGSFGRINNTNVDSDIISGSQKSAIQVAKKLNLKVLITNSNFADAFIQNHYLTATYSSIFAILCMQKLWKTYLYSSTFEFGEFSIVNNDENGSGKSELLLLNAFSTRNLRIYSEGAAKTRLEKIDFIADNELPQTYLHTCIFKTHNCTICHKCIRAMISLYVLGKLDNYKNIYDIDYFYKNKTKFLVRLCYDHYCKFKLPPNAENEYKILLKRNEINIIIKTLAILKLIKSCIRNIIKNKNILSEFK